LHPDHYGIQLLPPADIAFAHNDIEFVDPAGTDHDFLGVGLRKALYNYMHGVGLDADVRAWFEPAAVVVRDGRGARRRRRKGSAHAVPKTTVPPDLIERYLESEPETAASRVRHRRD
jgi:hypothetical protein